MLFLDIILKAQVTKVKINRLGPHQTKKLLHSKGNNQIKIEAYGLRINTYIAHM
jgi:hypothetical protein